MKDYNKTIITAALSGSQGTKNRNPYTPVTCDEMIEDAYQCYQSGASIVHIHTKANDQIHSEINYDKFLYIKQGIEDKCDMIVNFSTSGETNKLPGLEIMGTADGYQKKRLGIIELKPEIASFDVPSMNFGEKIFINPPSFLRTMGQRMQQNKVLPEVEIFGAGDIAIAKRLIAEGHLPKNAYFQLCLGVEWGTPATVKDLLYLSESLPPNVNWSAFGIARNHLPIMYTTLALGGNIRVGLEDNLYYERGRLTTNVELVERASRVVREFGNDVAMPNEARKILGLNF